ncbi:MAG: exodeoxyribonuclease III [Bacteroidia bacterium]
MKLISWNVNGLRAIVKKGNFDQIFELDPDIICFQETKAHPEDLPEEVRNPAGYFSHFDHSKGRKGYSGVAVYVKNKYENEIQKVEYGLGVEKYDQEGRFIAIFFPEFVLINCYFPNGGRNPERLEFKLGYYAEFMKYIEKQRKQGKKVIFCGDVNTAHAEIDLAHPKENQKTSGFLPIEREWIDALIKKGYLDTFRLLHPTQKDIYTWWDMKSYARDRNIGWRIDYFFVSEDLKDKIKKAEILDQVLGSDHCPVLLELK